MKDWLRGGGGSWFLPETVLQVIVLSVLVLFALTALFALLVLFLRTRHMATRRRRDELRERWHDALLEVLGGEKEPEALSASVQSGEEMHFLAFLLPFARRVKGKESELLQRAAASSLPRAEDRLRRRSSEVRALAVQMLGAFGLPAYAPHVLEALDDPSPYVAMTAAQALARREHAEHAPAVIARLWRFTNWSIDLLAAMLARVGPTVAEQTRRVFEDPHQPERARAAAADALRRLNDAHSAEAAANLLQTLHQPGQDVLTAAALRLLGHVGHAGYAEIARSWIPVRDPLVRTEAVRAFAALADPGELDELAPLLRENDALVMHETGAALIRAGRAELVEQVAAGDDAAALVARQTLAERSGR